MQVGRLISAYQQTSIPPVNGPFPPVEYADQYACFVLENIDLSAVGVPIVVNANTKNSLANVFNIGQPFIPPQMGLSGTNVFGLGIYLNVSMAGVGTDHFEPVAVLSPIQPLFKNQGLAIAGNSYSSAGKVLGTTWPQISVNDLLTQNFTGSTAYNNIDLFYNTAFNTVGTQQAGILGAFPLVLGIYNEGGAAAGATITINDVRVCAIGKMNLT